MKVWRQVFIRLMNLVENLSAKVTEQAEEIQRLRDEVNRLKGEQGKPRSKPKKPAPALSSEKERRESKPHHKAKKQAQVRIDRVEVVKVDQQRLPHDAQFKGYEDVIVQDIEFRTENVTFRKEKYYSPSQKRTYLADLPAGYTGPVWSESESVGLGSLLCRWDERAKNPGPLADSWHVDQCGTAL